MCRPFPLPTSRALPADVLNQCVVVLVGWLVHTVGWLDRVGKVRCRIFGLKYSGNAAENTPSRQRRLPAMPAMPTTARAETTRAAKILRISENIREYPQPSSSFSTSFTSRSGIHGLRKIRGRGNSPKKQSIHRPPFNEPRTKDGKRTSGIPAKRKGRHIHPYPSLDRHPAAGVMTFSR